MTENVVSVMSLFDVGHEFRAERLPARDPLVGGFDHDGHIAQQLAVPEEGARELALPAPAVAFRRQKSFTEDGLQHAAIEARLREAFGVLEKDAFDKLRIGDPGDERALAAVGDDGFFVRRRAAATAAGCERSGRETEAAAVSARTVSPSADTRHRLR